MASGSRQQQPSSVLFSPHTAVGPHEGEKPAEKVALLRRLLEEFLYDGDHAVGNDGLVRVFEKEEDLLGVAQLFV